LPKSADGPWPELASPLFSLPISPAVESEPTALGNDADPGRDDDTDLDAVPGRLRLCKAVPGLGALSGKGRGATFCLVTATAEEGRAPEKPSESDMAELVRPFVSRPGRLVLRWSMARNAQKSAWP